MSSDHKHDHHSTEQKPVSFTVPFILAAVTLLIIVLFLSLCDPKHGHKGECACVENCSKECKEACEKGDHSKHPAKCDESHGAATEAKTAAASEMAVDSSKTEVPVETTPAETAHH